ncbi:MAG: ribbon-helix-helix domain-containing protein [Janthinobacterium lividum]
MAPKRSSLFGSAASKSATDPETMSEDQAPAPELDAAPTRAPAPPALTEPSPANRYPKAKTREGKRVATVYLDREALRQLQKVGFDEETTIQALLVEGVNAVFERRGLSRIA